MQIIHSIGELRSTLDEQRRNARDVGFAPTMGGLHAGHESLMRAAASHDVAVASIFVNPLQFAPHEDLDSYPSTFDADRTVAENAGINLLFVPPTGEMYPEDNWTTVSLSVVTEPWEGQSRPTHFDGVATVVTKLFNIVGPSTAYFGEKDFQQLAMIRRMASDLNQQVVVVGMPTIREDDGLAMSSRNVRLTSEHRAQAPVVNEALRRGVAAIEEGERDPAVVEFIVRDVLAMAAAVPDYVAVVDAGSLRTPDVLQGEIRLLTAVKFGDVRLIDNVGTTVS